MRASSVLNWRSSARLTSRRFSCTEPFGLAILKISVARVWLTFLQSAVEISWRSTTWKSDSCCRRIKLVTLLKEWASCASVSIAAASASTTSTFWMALREVISSTSVALVYSTSSGLKAARYAITRVLRASATRLIFLLLQLMPSFSSSRPTACSLS